MLESSHRLRSWPNQDARVEKRIGSQAGTEIARSAASLPGRDSLAASVSPGPRSWEVALDVALQVGRRRAGRVAWRVLVVQESRDPVYDSVL